MFKYAISTRVREKPIVSILNPQPNDSILDVGCGMGHFTDLLSRAGARCTGIDADRECISYCQRHMAGEYIEGDVRKLPFPDNSFDKALCTEVLEHIIENHLVLKEMARVLKPQGILLVTTPCLDGIFGTLFKGIRHSTVNRDSLAYHHHKGYNRQTLNKLLTENNFSTNGDCHYVQVIFSEIFCGIQKIGITMLLGERIFSEANATKVSCSRLWYIYRKLFPVLLFLARIEQPLSPLLKGHVIMVKGTVAK